MPGIRRNGMNDYQSYMQWRSVKDSGIRVDVDAGKVADSAAFALFLLIMYKIVKPVINKLCG